MAPATSCSPGRKTAQPHGNTLGREGGRLVTHTLHLFRCLVTSWGCLQFPPHVNFELKLMTNILYQSVLLSDFGTRLPFLSQPHLPQVKKKKNVCANFCNWALMMEAFPLCGPVISQLRSLLCLSYNWE